LDELKQGGSNKALARRLDMTDNAVKFHLRNLYRKLGVHSRRMAVVVAQKRGF
jgi:LuxR family maltose regulon positive regulatory protein